MSHKLYDNIEFNWIKPLNKKPRFICDRCKENAIMECEVNTPNGKLYGAYCKGHYETLFQDLIEEMQDPLDANDLLIEED